MAPSARALLRKLGVLLHLLSFVDVNKDGTSLTSDDELKKRPDLWEHTVK